jgi:hypothetical protein
MVSSQQPLPPFLPSLALPSPGKLPDVVVWPPHSPCGRHGRCSSTPSPRLPLIARRLLALMPLHLLPFSRSHSWCGSARPQLAALPASRGRRCGPLSKLHRCRSMSGCPSACPSPVGGPVTPDLAGLGLRGCAAGQGPGVAALGLSPSPSCHRPEGPPRAHGLRVPIGGSPPPPILYQLTPPWSQLLALLR